MHVLQPKQIKLKPEDISKLLAKFNISPSQLPKISKKDPSLPDNAEVGDVLRIERKVEDGVQEYFRVVV